MKANARFVEVAQNRVIETEERLRLLRQQNLNELMHVAVVEVTEELLETCRALAIELQSHGKYMRDQLDYLTSLS